MDLPGASWVQLALQIPLALVIVFLTIYFLKHLEKANQAMLDFMKSQAGVNQEFLKQAQLAHNESISRLAEEIKNSKVETLRELSNLTQRVDGVIDKAIMLERLLPDSRK
jgi:hypothetical protein